MYLVFCIALTFWESLALAHHWHDAISPKEIECARNQYTKSGECSFQTPPVWVGQEYASRPETLGYDELNKTLYPLVFNPLPLGSVKPLGWIRQQLELMADGLPGHMHEFYRLVSNATWGGGTHEYSELNEAWPYYINGIVPLAFSIEDRSLRTTVYEQISFVLLSQFSDGWLGPEEDVLARNFWGRYPFFLAAAQYVEAADFLEGQSMLQAMHRFVNLMHQMLKNDHEGFVWKQGDHFSQGNEQWGRSRTADMVLALQWLYENHPADNHRKIHECMFMLYEKAFDWSWWFRDDIYLKEDIETYPPEVIDPLFPFLHAVNAAQGLKSPAIMGRLLHDSSLFESSRRGVELTFKHHGTSSGAIVGDERISGNSPARGTELCSVVETMFSLSTLYQTLGDASFADRLENAAFNAMPAMIMPNWWAHQYVAQTNQPFAYEVPNTHFWNVGPWGLTFGLEPNYPCCTVNFPQGYPKLLSSSWVRTPKTNGLAHVVLLPSEVKIVLKQKDIDNNVYIRCETNYPFTQLLQYYVEAQSDFKFSFRVPGWVDLTNPQTGIYLDKNVHETSGRSQQPISSSRDPQPLDPDSHTGLHTIRLPAGSISFSVYLSPFKKSSKPKPVIHKRPNGAISLTHGALLFAQTFNGEYTARRPVNYQRPGEAPLEAHDWTIVPRMEKLTTQSGHSNLTKPLTIPWNIAIDPDTARVHENANLYSSPDCDKSSNQSCYNDWPDILWSEFSLPVSISVMACEIEWPLTAPIQFEDVDGTSRKRAVRGGYPVPPPLPNHKYGHKCIGRAFPIDLKPYGGAKIRMAEFPTVDLSPGSHSLYTP